MKEEQDREEPINREEGVYRVALATFRVVLTGGIEAAKPETREKVPERPNQRPSRQPRMRVRVIPRTEE